MHCVRSEGGCMKILFMGTPDFAVSILKALTDAGHEIVLAVTQPDKPRGRKGILTPPDVKVFAQEHGIEVFQPKKVRDPEAVAEIQKHTYDVGVVAAYGQILPQTLLDTPRLGCVNVHASLLPKYRGAAPIQWAVINGDEYTGVTTMQMDAGLDDGDILLQEKKALDPWETGGSLFDRLASVGGELIVKTLAGLEAGTITPVPQNEEGVTKVGLIRKDMGKLDFTKSAKELECKIRGLNPWPSAYTYLNGKPLKIWKAGVLSEENHSARDPRDPEDVSPVSTAGSRKALPGTVIAVTENAIAVKCGRDVLRLDEVQIAGKRRMKTADFLRGHHVEVGEVLG